MLGFTIDSIKLFVSWEQLEKFDYETFKKKLKKVKNYKKYYRDKNGYMAWTKGTYRNFHINFSKSKGIYLAGSISNYYKDYSSLLSYFELKQAIEKLGLELDLCLNDARIYRIDLALNIQTDNPIEQYSHYLFGDLSKFKRLEQDKGVLFKTTSKSFCIYNKSLQLKQKKGIDCRDVLRLEFRLLKGVSKFFGVEKMKTSNLYNTEIFLKLLYGFQDVYNRIEKKRIPKDFSDLEYINPKILSSWMKIKNVVSEFGGESEFYRMIEQADLEGKFKNANDKSRCRKVIRDLSNNDLTTKPHPFISEISEKIDLEIEKFKTNITNS
ncbi:hypothetical protein [Chryseobacterium binzhouense]|uniref:hypothetical protein n=1 Tax=Chryseobacterium binzhouense TaxID=2593646 RepID=UPI00117ECC79|nr:hypothetical protein [Chryseobacterium binzhouense]